MSVSVGIGALQEIKCGRLYKLKKENLVRARVSRISLEGSSSRGGASKKTTMGRELGQSVAIRRKGVFGKGSRWPKP